jgi:hypothetical protein
MLQRKNGATLAEIMDKMGWQRHTVRGFMAGFLALVSILFRPAQFPGRLGTHAKAANW